jgi:hypothetical protein
MDQHGFRNVISSFNVIISAEVHQEQDRLSPEDTEPALPVIGALPGEENTFESLE